MSCPVIAGIVKLMQAKPFPRHFNVMHEKMAKKSFIVNSMEDIFVHLITDVSGSCISFFTSSHRYGKPSLLCKQM